MIKLFLTILFSSVLCGLAQSSANDPVRAGVARGVAYLVGQQNSDGVFLDPDPQRNRSHQSVMTALGVLAMAAVGHQPADRTPEGEALRRAVNFLVTGDRQTPEGYFGAKDGSRMYGHGIITLALTELLGMGLDGNQDRLIRERSQKAIELILRSQRVRKFSSRFDGGWRYTPDSGDSDLSITVWQLMALRSAKNAGLNVPKEAIDAAVEYLRQSYKSERDDKGRPLDLRSGFGYQPGSHAEYATTSAGLLALQVCGVYEAPEVVGAADWLLDLTTGGSGGRRTRKLDYGQKWFFYGTYYYSQAMQKRGGEYAQQAWQFTEKAMLENQSPDGSWLSGDGQERLAGRIYSTSLAILSLSVKYHYLPIYQY